MLEIITLVACAMVSLFIMTGVGVYVWRRWQTRKSKAIGESIRAEAKLLDRG